MDKAVLLLDAGFTDVTTDLFPINAGPGMTWTMHPVFDRFVELMRDHKKS